MTIKNPFTSRLLAAETSREGDRATTLEAVYAYEVEPEPMSLSGSGGAERVYGGIVTANYFAALGTQPRLGRLLQDSDDAVVGGSAVTVISHELWERRFGSSPAIVGQAISLNSHPFQIVGVAPRGFQGTTVLRSDLWIPVSMIHEGSPRRSAGALTSRGSSWLFMGARLKPGATAAQASAELASIGAALEREYPEANEGRGYKAMPLGLLPGQRNMVAGFLGLLMGIVGLVLMIACVNVAGMLLARAASRQREIAIRIAVGAGRARLIRQLLTETSMLFLAGGCLGLVLTKWLTALLLSVLPQLPVPLAVEIGTDWRVVAFATVVSLAAALLAGLAPAVQASRADLVPALKADAMNAAPSRLRLRNAFVIGQIAMSLMLVIAGGLFLRAIGHALDLNPGFDQTSVDVVSADLSLAGFRQGTGEQFARDLVARTRAIPGVESASLATDLPLDGGRSGMGSITVPGRQPPDGQDSFPADWNAIEPGYFRTLRLPLLRGRDFSDGDAAGSPRVAIINEVFARALWPGGDAVGRQIRVNMTGTPEPATIVGVTSDARLISRDAPAAPAIYVPYAQRFTPRVWLVVRHAGAVSAIPQVRALVRDMNPNLPVTQAMPLDQVTALGLIPLRIALSVAGTLGVVGLLLAAIGIYGVTSYAVSRRTREIGIRIALGANRTTVMSMVLRQGLGLAATGIAIGLALAAAGSGLLQGLLFGIRGLDPLTFAGACLLFTIITLAASYLPARRATAVDPMVALRND